MASARVVWPRGRQAWVVRGAGKVGWTVVLARGSVAMARGQARRSWADLGELARAKNVRGVVVLGLCAMRRAGCAVHELPGAI